MAEVLSQQEIDQLLNKVKSGDQPVAGAQGGEEDAMPFDFRLPNRISKNQLRTIRNIHDNFSEGLASFLVTKLQTIVNINVTTVDQIYYSEYILSVSSPGCLFTFELKDTDIKGILEISPELALSLVDRLLGGNGSGSKQNKLITHIEQKVLLVVVDRVMQDLKKAWQVVEDFDFVIERFESDIDFAQITSQNESVLLVGFELMIGEQAFTMNIAFATYAFDIILAKLSSQKMSTIRPGKYKGTTAREIISNHLGKTYLPVSVEFGTTKITMNDIFNFEKGDIIKLENKITDEHTIKIGNRVLFFGRTGIVNNHKAVKITRKNFSNEK